MRIAAIFHVFPRIIALVFLLLAAPASAQDWMVRAARAREGKLIHV
jgi:hypothetical protein